MSPRGRRLFLLPVRRRLMGVTIAWLAGIYAARLFVLPVAAAVFLCAFLTGAGLCLRIRRKSAFFCACITAVLLGNQAAGHQLALSDVPTDGKAVLSGTISAIKAETRVYLRDVTVNGESAPVRDVLVTLMTEKDEAAPEVFVGQRVSGTGRLFSQRGVRNPGGVDQRIQALCDGYELSGYILPGWAAEGREAFSLREAFRRLREALLAHIGAVFGEDAPLFQGVMLGERGGMEADTVAALRLTGTAHILTVSGLHLSLLAAVLERLLRRTGLGRGGKLVCQGIVLGAFAGLTGCAAGTVRALIMAMMRALAAVRGRRYEPLTALSAAALVMTAARPVWALSASFQFSFFVVLGVLLLERGLSAWLCRRCPSRMHAVARAFSLSASAQLAALPMTLLLYGYVPLLALPMNMLCGVLVPAVMLGGWISAFAGLLYLNLGIAAGSVAALPARAFEAMSLAAADVQGGVLRLPAPYTLVLLLFAAVMMLASDRIRFGGRRRAAAGLMTALMALSYLPRFCPAVRYVQLDVGQGDGSLIRRGRHAVLTDVGPDDSYDMLRYLRHEGLYVDGVILSHLDEDHAGALLSLLRSEIDVNEIVMACGAPDDVNSRAVGDALTLAHELGVTVRFVSLGDEISLGGEWFAVLSPDEALVGSNERSLVLYTEAEGVALLLTGDLPMKSEPAAVPSCDVLKVAHHGSKNATSDAFLLQTTPELALISVGEGNGYGHPAQRVLDSLEAVGARTLRTDESGCITLWLREGNWRAETMNNP
ncbi:MAG: DNA internalization-related competence protein ComEC/Rec2 [Clostridia bacterium]|nr:DNA internalization-related competence protein ComEC/Rec2 [Clostridia bacterium]